MGTVVFFVLFLIVSVVVFAIRNQSDREFKTGASVVSVVLFLAAWVTLGLGSYTIIEPGHRGVQVTLGNMNMTPLEEGFQIINPICSVTEYSIQMQKTKVRYLAISSDTQEVEIEFAFNWKTNPAELCSLIKDNTEHYGEVLFETATTEAVKAEVVKYPISQIADKRPTIKAAVQATLTTWLGKYGILIKEASITDIDFSELYNEAIEAKQVQEQQALTEENILRQKEVKARQAKAEATGKADAVIEKARGDAAQVTVAAEAKAKAITLVATAQAEANLKIRESLNAEILRQMWLESWDGVLPRFLTAGGDSDLSLILPSDVVGK